MPQIVEVAGFVARPIGERKGFLSRDFVQRIDADQPVVGKVRKFLIAAKNGTLLEWKDQLLAQGNVYLHVVAAGKRPDVPQIKRITVFVCLTVLAVEPEDNAGRLTHRFVYRFKAPDEVGERNWLGERKIEIFRKSVITEIASFERGTTFESQDRFEIRFRQGTEEPCKAIVPFEDGLLNAAITFLGEPVCE